MGGNTPNTLVVYEPLRRPESDGTGGFMCASDATLRSVGGILEVTYIIEGGPICSCNAANGDSTVTCASCAAPTQWLAEQCSCST